jgi:hypothetical protein
MRRLLFPILFLILNATAAHPQSTAPMAPIETGVDACKYAVIYNGKEFLDPDVMVGIYINIGVCEDWARKQENWQAAHNSFAALDSLYQLQTGALKSQLYAHDNAPPTCKVFLDDEAAVGNAISAGVTAKLPDSEVEKNASRAEKEFRAAFSESLERSEQAVTDLSACSDWASEHGLTVIALEVQHVADELNADDPRQIPASIENATPVCKNAESEANAVSDFVEHADDNSIMPHDVVPYFERATVVMHCAERLARSKYRDAEDHLLLAVASVNNLMVIAEGNSEAKLIHSLPPPQSNRPIIVRVESPSYQPSPSAIPPTSSPKHCSGTVTDLGGFSTIDWGCN